MKASRTAGIDLNLLFGLDSKLFHEPVSVTIPDHDREVQTFTILKGAGDPAGRHCERGEECGGEGHGHLEVEPNGSGGSRGLERSLLLDALGSLSKETIWRVKGFVRLLPENQVYILNWAFGRYELEFCDAQNASTVIQLTVMGQRGEMKRLVHKFAERLGGNVHT